MKRSLPIPEVTAETISSTICMREYTKRLRPDAEYVSDMKIKIGRDAGLTSDVAAAMILDHIIPLALGGHPSEPSNLQLQDAAESYRKDRIERKLRCLVCTGQVSLDEARAAIATDWQAAISPIRQGEMSSQAAVNRLLTRVSTAPMSQDSDRSDKF